MEIPDDWAATNLLNAGINQAQTGFQAPDLAADLFTPKFGELQ
jgi:hypothetical protein